MSSQQNTSDVANHATPFELAGDRANPDTVRFVDDTVRDATVVGLGEACHGVREFHALTHRLFASLVEHHGVRAFGLEAGFAEARAIDRYVRTGDTDTTAVDALDALSFWIWRTESMCALVEWIREYNRDRPPEDAVRFYGLDCQWTGAPADELRRYFDTVDPSVVDCLDTEFDTASDGIQMHFLGEDPDDESFSKRVAVVEELQTTLTERLDEKRAEYVDTAGESEYELARHHLRLLEQAIDLAAVAREDGKGGTYSTQRDEYMAETVKWILSQQESPIAICAANGHLRTGNDHHDRGPEVGPLGYHLDNTSGLTYRAIASVFGSGTVRKAGSTAEDERLFPAQSVASPPDETLHATLLAACDSPAYLETGVRSADEVPDALLGDRLTRALPPGYDPEASTGFEREYRADFTREFDGVCFLPEVSAAEVLSSDTGTDSDTDTTGDDD